jgi:hypothetical protein
MSARLLTRSSRILGPDGRPASTWLYPTPRHNPRLYKPRFWLSPDFRTNVSAYDRQELVNLSRQLVSQIGDLGTAIAQKNSWAFKDGWDAHYVGKKNRKWGDEAEEFLRDQFYPACNVRGPLFDFRQTLYLSGLAWDRDGDDVVILTESESHFPMIAVFPATRIASGDNEISRRIRSVEGGRFDGAKIVDGIITNRDGRAIAVRIIGEDDSVKPSDVAMFNADLAFDPAWTDQGRGVPAPSTCCLKWMNRQDLDEFLQAGMKRAATLALKRKTAEGESMGGNEITTAEETIALPGGGSVTREIHVEQVGSGGDIIELSAADGEDIDVLTYKNPHPNAEAFVERMTRECLASVGWYYELLNLSSTGRAPTRLLADLANQVIWSRQSTAERRARRIIRYALHKGMKEKLLSRNDDVMDTLRWEFGLPKEVSVDAGNDEQADREALKMGMTTKAIIAQKKGLRGEMIRRQRLAEVKQDYLDAKELGQELGVPWEHVMERLEQRSPNPVIQQPRPQPKSLPPPTN